MTRARCSIRPSLECLEVRDTPAGTVIATLTGGQLTLTGDAAANVVLITQEPDDRLTISDNGSGTQFLLNGGPAKDAVTLPVSVPGVVTISLGGGADELIIDGIELPGSLWINGGNGAGDGPAGNTVRLQGIHIGGDLGITNLAGADATHLLGTMNVQGGLSIRNGPGGSAVWGDDTTDLHVGGILSVGGGVGADMVDLWGAVGVTVGGLAFRSGADRDGSYFRVHPFGDLTVAGGVQVTNGAGEDFTNLGGENLAVGGSIVIRNGGGGSRNTLLTQASLSTGEVVIINGAGEDHNDIHIYDTALIRGRVRFVNGAGDSFNYVGDGNLFSIKGNVTFLNGTGRDLNTVFSGDARIGGAVTVRNADGGSDTSIAAESLLFVAGPTWIASESGNDLITVGEGRVGGDQTPAVDVGPVHVSNGDGGSETVILGSTLVARGSLTVAAGDGTDGVMMSSEADSGSVAGNVFIDIGPGDQQAVAVGTDVGQVLTIGGALGIWADDPVGPNSVYLSGVDVRFWTEIWTGAGADEVGVTGSTFRGAFELDTWKGDDKVYLEWAGGATTFRGQVWVITGEGNDWVMVAGDEEIGGQVVFTGATSWDGGAGSLDALVVRFTGGVFLGPEPVVTRFEVAF
jgi:hypothetical protein